MDFLNIIVVNKVFMILIICVCFDTIFGILRAIKQKKTNSAIGIDGMIRKSGMLISSIFMYLIDYILQLNFISFLPESILNFLNIKTLGIGSLFGILFVVFEFLSILKNMYLCGLPIPLKLKVFLEKVLKDFTKEIKEGD